MSYGKVTAPVPAPANKQLKQQLSDFVSIRKLQAVALANETNNEYITHSIGPFEFSWQRNHKELVRIRDTSAFCIDAWIRRDDLEHLLSLYREAVSNLASTNKEQATNASIHVHEKTRMDLGAGICSALRSAGFWTPKDVGSNDVVTATATALAALRKPLQDFADSQECRPDVFASSLERIDSIIEMGKWAATAQDMAPRAIEELTAALQQMRNVVTALMVAGHISKSK